MKLHVPRSFGLWRLARHLPVKTDFRGVVLDRMPKGGECAEIGVWRGEFSRRILEITRPRLLHLIDPWRYVNHNPALFYGGAIAKSQADMDRIYREVVGMFADHTNVEVHRSTFLDACLDIREGDSQAFLDWAYIDGDHRFHAVARDLAIAFQFVKPGCWVAGDDYAWRDRDGRASVTDAVRCFCMVLGVDYELIGDQYMMRMP